jgi:hypothetical protein
MPVEAWLLAAFLALALVVGVPLIRFGVHLPAELDIATVPDDGLTPEQGAYFQRLDEKMRGLGYAPQLNFTVLNFQGGTLSRVYTGAYDAAVLGAHLMRGHAALDESQVSAQNYQEWITRYEDGTTLTTRNAELGELFDRLPGQVVQDVVGAGVVDLKGRHDRRARELLGRVPRHVTAAQGIEEFKDYHRRWCAFQVERGLMVRDATGEKVHPTVRTALRGVFNFLNPLADNFTWPRFLAGVVAGAGLPLAAALAADLGFLPGPSWVGPALAATGAGAVIGVVFTGKAFVWSLLLGYLPLRLLGEDPVPQLLLALWMGFVAESVARVQDRRRLLV